MFLNNKEIKKMNLQIRQVKIVSWEYGRWKPFNFVVGEGAAHEMVLICISDKSNSIKPYMCNFGGCSIKRF